MAHIESNAKCTLKPTQSNTSETTKQLVSGSTHTAILPDEADDDEHMTEEESAIHEASIKKACKHLFELGYEVKETLGVGRHGEVKKCVHNASGCLVAVKIIPFAEGSASGPWSETAALKHVRHPHIVRLFDVIQTASHEMLVLECLSGGELFDYLVSRQRLTEREGRKFIRQMVRALHFCHRRGVVHRDLKLENLLLDGDGNIKITDFGFSNHKKDSDGLCSTFVGSPAYAAPEIIANEKYAGPPADVWSLGVIITTVLTGAHPFQDPNVATKFDKIDRADVTLPDFLSKEAKNLIRSVLRRNPRERLSTAQIWNHPWMAGTEGGTEDGTESIEGTPPPPVDPALHKSVCEELARSHGMDTPTLERELEQELVSSTTAMYYLMMEKMERDKARSVRDAEIALASAKLAGLMGSNSPFRSNKKKGGASTLWMSPAQRNSDTEHGDKGGDNTAHNRMADGGFATPPRRKPRMSEDLSGPTPPPLSLSSLRESLKLPSFLSRPAKQLKTPSCSTTPAILEAVDEDAAAVTEESPTRASNADGALSTTTNGATTQRVHSTESSGASKTPGYHHLRVHTSATTDDTALLPDGAPPADGRRSKSLSAIDDATDDDEAADGDAEENTDDVFHDEPQPRRSQARSASEDSSEGGALCSGGSARGSTADGRHSDGFESPAPQTPRGHRMSTDIDTGKRVLTPLRRASRASGASNTPLRSSYNSPVPGGGTPRVRSTSSATRRTRRSSTPGGGGGVPSVLRKRNSRAGLVTRQMGSGAGVGGSTPTALGSRKVSHRISSRGALLAMRRHNPLRETTIGAVDSPSSSAGQQASDGTPTQPSTRTGHIASDAACPRGATPQTPQIVVDGTVLFTLEGGDAPVVDSTTTGVGATAAAPSRVASDETDTDDATVSISTSRPPAARKQSGNHLVPLSVFSGEGGQRTASEGAGDAVGGGSAGTPPAAIDAQALRKLRSDGGTRTFVHRDPAGPGSNDHVARAQVKEAAARTMVQDLPQSLDLAVSLPTTTFGAATTSSLPPHLMVAEVTRALTRMNVDFHFATPHKIVCECRVLRDVGRTRAGGTKASSKLYRSDSTKEARELVSWEMEICLLPRLGMHGIRLRRICGDIWKYKQKVSQVTASMKL